MKIICVTAIICFSLQNGKAFAQTNLFHPPTINKTNKMKEFSLLVRVPTTYTSEQAKAVNSQWNATIEQWKRDSVYVTSFAFPGESYVVEGPDKLVKKESVVSDGLRVVSNIVLKAASMEEATELAKACPVLAYGGTVEVREIPVRRVAQD